MELTKDKLIEEIKTLKKASEIHTKYSIMQYKKVLKLLEELKKEKKLLEKKVEERTRHLKKEIEENIKLNKKLKELANFDALTRLLNRRAFSEKLHTLKNEDFSVMFLDLDGFKQVNDIYGHKVGDELLKIVAKRIINALRSEDIVGRLGGDEFVILIKGKKEKKDLEVIAKKLIEKISSPIIIGDIKTKVGTSIGIYIRNKKDPINKALSFADAAMYEAKKNGKGKFVFFSSALNKQFLKKKLKKALEEKNIKKILRPVCDGDKIFFKELLVDFEELEFREILEILEEDKLIERFIFVLLDNLNEKVLIHLHYKLLNENFLNKLRKYNNLWLGIDAKDMKYVDKKMLEKFAKYFPIVIDKFEESNFALYCFKYPISAVKIDKEFIDKKDKKIFEAILETAKNFNIKVIFKCFKNCAFCVSY